MQKIGFIGLGTMGKPMAKNLIKAGFELKVWNRSPAPMKELAKLGAIEAENPQEVARDIDVLITMLSDDVAENEVLIHQGAISSLGIGATHINMATISVKFALKLQELHAIKNHKYIAAPVLGRFDVAEAGNLNILAAGDNDAIKEVQPIFDAIGQKTWIFGNKPEQANAVKLAANAMIATAIGSMGETSALVAGFGVNKAEYLEMISSTLFNAPVYKNYGALIAADNYEPAGFKLKLGLKDVRLGLEAGDSTNVPMPISGVLRDSFLEAMAHSEANLDWAAMARIAARRANQIRD